MPHTSLQSCRLSILLAFKVGSKLFLTRLRCLPRVKNVLKKRVNQTCGIHRRCLVTIVCHNNVDENSIKMERHPKQETPKRETFLTQHGIKLGPKLDSGGFGVVYKASKKGETIAVKVIKVENVNEDDLQREIAILRTVKHKNVILCHGIFRTRHKVWIFMEFAPGGTVAKFVRKYGGYPEWGAKIVMKQTIDGLMYLHGKQIAHRDLKLDNILLDENSNPKLTDFGLSRFVQLDEKNKPKLSDTFCGTESYMSPEIHQSKPYDPMIADVWSLGICLYYMLNEKYPFDRHHKNEMIKKQQRKEWKFSATFEQIATPEIRDLISKILEPDTEKRIKLADCLKHPWFPKYREAKKN